MSDILNSKGFKAIAMHGDKPQRERERALESFRTGRSNIMVATDVASRGLDIDDIMLVINYDFPTQIEDYVHRIGRTARQEKKGTSYTFFTVNEKKHAQKLISVLEEANQNISDKLYDLADTQFGSRRKPTSNVPRGILDNNNWGNANASKRPPLRFNGETPGNREQFYSPLDREHKNSNYYEYNGNSNDMNSIPAKNNPPYRETINWRNNGSYNNFDKPVQSNFSNNFTATKSPFNYNDDFNSMGIIANRW